MQHTIPIESLGSSGQAMADAVSACVHCGFCLPACPTYRVLGEEMDSPRGRITLMKAALEGSLTVEETLPYVDRCLGCLGCVTACPSGVSYGELLQPYRALAEKQRQRPPMDRFARLLVRQTLPYPARFRLAAQGGRLARPLRRLLPAQLRAMLGLLPARLPAPSQPLPEHYPAVGQRRARVALLAGCVQQVMAPEINWATLRVLARNGVEVIVPPGQGCCGALLMHSGDDDGARSLAARNLRAFPDDVDAIITNAAGCGSGLHDYAHLFSGRPEERQARALASRALDVSVFLDNLGLRAPPPLPHPLRLAYHDACHLVHAQGVAAAPRRLLGTIDGLTVLEVPEGELCCGSAGTYNLDQPDVAGALGRRKAENVLRTDPQAVVAGNIGCLVQIRSHLENLNQPLPVYHTLEVLDQAYRGLL
jgi:glycolate oxidase iron-sulfur subunit